VHPTAEILERAGAAFASALRVPFREDAALAGDLAKEAVPVIDALGFAIAAAGGDPLALEFREGLAMGALLGRRAAMQRATPSVALALVDALVAALGAIDRAPAPKVVEALRSVVVEGYCAAVEEHVRGEAARRAAEALAPSRIAPQVWAIVVAGEHAPETLAEALDRAGRALLDADARACLVHLALASRPSEDLAAEIFAFDATAKLVGAQCVFSGVTPEWRAAARPRLDPDPLAIEETLEKGLERALATAGVELRGSSAIVQRIRRFLGGSEPPPAPPAKEPG
jgi:hypothetical protein